MQISVNILAANNQNNCIIISNDLARIIQVRNYYSK